MLGKASTSPWLFIDDVQSGQGTCPSRSPDQPVVDSGERIPVSGLQACSEVSPMSLKVSDCPKEPSHPHAGCGLVQAESSTNEWDSLGGVRTGQGQGSRPSFLKRVGFLVVAPTGIGDTSAGKLGWAKVVLG